MDVVQKVVKSEGPLGTSSALAIDLVITKAWVAGIGLYAGMEATMWRSVSRVSSTFIWMVLTVTQTFLVEWRLLRLYLPSTGAAAEAQGLLPIDCDCIRR